MLGAKVFDLGHRGLPCGTVSSTPHQTAFKALDGRNAKGLNEIGRVPYYQPVSDLFVEYRVVVPSYKGSFSAFPVNRRFLFRPEVPSQRCFAVSLAKVFLVKL